MGRHKLSRESKKLVHDRLVEDKVDEFYHSIGLRPDIAGVKWQSPNSRSRGTRLETAYGKLVVPRDWAGWMTMRDGDPLVHPRSPRAVFFASQCAAKAAGLLHLKDGFGDALPRSWKYGLSWKMKREPITPIVSQFSLDFRADTAVPDNHEYGNDQLKRLVEKSGLAASYADRELLRDLERVAQWWQLASPTWTKRGHGCFELATPYGVLVVRRVIGWIVERSGLPRLWATHPHNLVIFDKLEHAQMCGLIHAQDYGDLNRPDGTRWGTRSLDELPQQYRALDQSAVHGANHVFPG
jgi:hypothetical protein